MTLRILTDTASDIPDSMADELGIGLIPLNIHFGDEQLKDRRDITGGEFFDRLASSSVHPTTSQPSPGEWTLAGLPLRRVSQRCEQLRLPKMVVVWTRPRP